MVNLLCLGHLFPLWAEGLIRFVTAKPREYCHPAKFSSTALEKKTALPRKFVRGLVAALNSILKEAVTGPRTNFRARFVF